MDIDGVEVAEIYARGLGSLNGSGHVPAKVAVSLGGIHAEAADPVIARGKAVDEGAAVEVGIRFANEEFGLSNLRS